MCPCSFDSVNYWNSVDYKIVDGFVLYICKTCQNYCDVMYCCGEWVKK